MTTLLPKLYSKVVTFWHDHPSLAAIESIDFDQTLTISSCSWYGTMTYVKVDNLAAICGLDLNLNLY